MHGGTRERGRHVYTYKTCSRARPWCAGERAIARVTSICAQKVARSRPLCEHGILWVRSHANTQGRTIHQFLCPARMPSRRPADIFTSISYLRSKTDVSKYLLFARREYNWHLAARSEGKLRQVNSEGSLMITFRSFFCNPPLRREIQFYIYRYPST